MLLTSWRIVPLMALASRESFTGTKLSLPSLLETLTSTFWASDRAPPAPLTLIWSSLMDTSTPAGIVLGFFSSRYISVSSQCRGSGHISRLSANNTGGALLSFHHDGGGGAYKRNA